MVEHVLRGEYDADGHVMALFAEEIAHVLRVDLV